MARKSALKTRPTPKRSVAAFLAAIEDPQRRADCRALIALMRAVTKSPPVMWGASVVGFGRYDYVYPTGNSGSWFEAGFSPRARNLTVYIMAGFEGYQDLLARLGRHSTGKSCLYLTSLDEVDRRVLKQLVTESVRAIRRRSRPASGTTLAARARRR